MAMSLWCGLESPPLKEKAVVSGLSGLIAPVSVRGSLWVYVESVKRCRLAFYIVGAWYQRGNVLPLTMSLGAY